MKIAILGAGLAGLSAARSLNGHKIALFDPLGIGKKASGVSAGLLHPFVGKHAKKNWRSEEAINATLELFSIAEKILGAPVAKKTGLKRIALTKEQLEDYQATHQNHPDEVAWDGKTLFIKNGWSVDTPLYLQGLWLALKKRGVELIQDAVLDLGVLQSYDRIIVAAGADTPKILDFPLQLIKGQILEFEKQNPLEIPISSSTYVMEKGSNILVGATYEHHFLNEEADLETAKKLLLPKTLALMPELAGKRIVACRAGVRAVHPTRRPVIKQINDKTFVFTGLGSKGLLYHALFGKAIPEIIL